MTFNSRMKELSMTVSIKTSLRVAAVAALMIATGPALRAAEFTASPGSRLWLNGTSTLHPFSSSATAMAVTADFDVPGADLDKAVLTKLAVSVPVDQLSSGEKGLDKNMRKTLKGEAFPLIRFESTAPVTLETAGAGTQARVPGRLSVAGVTKEVTIEAELRREGDAITAAGHQVVKMTDYGVRPPTMMGVIKTGDDITVGFDLKLVAAAPAPAKVESK
jgi:polyisoprenoid-binding protein YceI